MSIKQYSKKHSLLYVTIFLLTFPSLAFAHEKEHEEEKKNEISLFVGGSSNIDATAFAIGADYQYRIIKVIGVGAIIDVATGDIGSVMIGPAAFIHVWNFEFTVAPTAEFSDDDITAVLRLGIAYEFELPGFSISPSLNFDTERGGEETLVYGLSFGFEF